MGTSVACNKWSQLPGVQR